MGFTQNRKIHHHHGEAVNNGFHKLSRKFAGVSNVTCFECLLPGKRKTKRSQARRNKKGNKDGERKENPKYYTLMLSKYVLAAPRGSLATTHLSGCKMPPLPMFICWSSALSP
jgi:hypothetical protein